VSRLAASRLLSCGSGVTPTTLRNSTSNSSCQHAAVAHHLPLLWHT
jgi:hypothetical protein